MSDTQAAARYGREFSYGTDSVTVGSETCRHAAYHTSSLPTDSLLHVGFRITARALALPGGEGARTEVTEVTCGDVEWVAPGTYVLWIDRDRAYTVWDGVFFELRRISP